MRPSRAKLAAFLLCSVAALTGCQVVSSTSQYAQVRFLEVSPDAPPMDIYQNGTPMLYSVGFGTASSYIAVPAGQYTYAANTAGLHQQLVTTAGSLAAGVQYTVLIGNNVAALQMSILKDQAAPPTPGQASVRLLHQGTRSGALDLYLVPPGGRLSHTSPIATGILFTNSAPYLSVPTGTYSLVALPAGTSVSVTHPPLFSGSQVEYTSGSAHTIVLIDQSPGSTPGLQALTTDDID